MTAEVRIEVAGPQDAAVLLELIRALASYERLEHLVAADVGRLRDELAATPPMIEALLAWDGGRAVGFALYFSNYSTFLGRRGIYLEDLFVLPQARGRGIGRRLMLQVAGLAVERGCGRFEWTVLDWNQPAIDFYRGLGAELLPDWRVCRLTGPALQRLASRAG